MSDLKVPARWKTALAALASMAVLGTPAAGTNHVATAPDLSGLWAREYFGFEPPLSGPGPIQNLSRLRSGESDLNQFVGDWLNPILKPAAAGLLKSRGEISLNGRNFPEPSDQCTLEPVPYILWQQEIQLLQRKNEVVLLYMHSHEARHVRLNTHHPAHLTPSWH